MIVTNQSVNQNPLKKQSKTDNSLGFSVVFGTVMQEKSKADESNAKASIMDTLDSDSQSVTEELDELYYKTETEKPNDDSILEDSIVLFGPVNSYMINGSISESMSPSHVNAVIEEPYQNAHGSKNLESIPNQSINSFSDNSMMFLRSLSQNAVQTNMLGQKVPIEHISSWENKGIIIPKDPISGVAQGISSLNTKEENIIGLDLQAQTKSDELLRFIRGMNTSELSTEIPAQDTRGNLYKTDLYQLTNVENMNQQIDKPENKILEGLTTSLNTVLNGLSQVQGVEIAENNLPVEVKEFKAILVDMASKSDSHDSWISSVVEVEISKELKNISKDALKSLQENPVSVAHLKEQLSIFKQTLDELSNSASAIEKNLTQENSTDFSNVATISDTDKDINTRHEISRENRVLFHNLGVRTDTIPNQPEGVSMDRSMAVTDPSNYIEKNIDKMSTEILKSMDVIREGEISTVKVSLHPKELGDMEIRLTMENGKISGKLILETAELKQLFQGKMQELQDTLKNQNIQVQKLEVSTSMEGHSQQNSNQNSKNQDWTTTPRFYAQYPVSKPLTSEYSEDTRVGGKEQISLLA